MAAPPLISAWECIVALSRLGYVRTRQRGSHVRLGADAETPYQGMATLLSLLRRAGIQRIAFATLAP